MIPDNADDTAKESVVIQLVFLESETSACLLIPKVIFPLGKGG